MVLVVMFFWIFLDFFKFLYDLAPLFVKFMALQFAINFCAGLRRGSGGICDGFGFQLDCSAGCRVLRLVL